MPSNTAKDAADDPSENEAKDILTTCETNTISGDLMMLALERQIESTAVPVQQGITSTLRELRLSLHTLTIKMMIVRACFDMPLADDSEEIFAIESQRRGRKLRHLGRHPRKQIGTTSKLALTGATSAQATAEMNPEEVAAAEAAEAQ